MKSVSRLISEAAVIDVAVLITGETGTGKELVARAIHHLGHRRHQPFVKVSCDAVAPEVLERDLFGHEAPAFPEAPTAQSGKLDAAKHGTIFLDEIGDLPPALQAKLLHVLEDGQFSRVGAWSTVSAEVRVLASTNRDLEPSIAAGVFRKDLFYRLSAIRIDVPPLRQRPEDIPGLAELFVRRYCALFERPSFTVPPAAMQRLTRHSFPGNVRELENLVKRMILLRDLDLAPLPPADPAGRQRAEGRNQIARPPLRSLHAISRKAAQTAEQRAIRAALEVTRWNRRRAARLLNISYRALLYKIKVAGLNGLGPKTPDLS
jgi:DNA-binding NtrC family response regulator